MILSTLEYLEMKQNSDIAELDAWAVECEIRHCVLADSGVSSQHWKVYDMMVILS